MLRSCGTQPSPRRHAGPAAAARARARELDAARAIARDADERREQRRLAGAVASEQRERAPFAERESHVVDDDRLAVAGAQPRRAKVRQRLASPR
jgi:hypothetical protein